MDRLGRSIALSVSMIFTQIPFVLIVCLVYLKWPLWVAAVILVLVIISIGRTVYQDLQYKKNLLVDLEAKEAEQVSFSIGENFPGRSGHYIYHQQDKFFISEVLLTRQKVKSGESAEIDRMPRSGFVLRFNGQNVTDPR